MTGKAAELYALLLRDSRQLHRELNCNLSLVKAAEAKALEMGVREYFGHCNPEGVCSNTIAIVGGCRLPSFYTPNGNNIESLAAGSDSVELIFLALAASGLHANHIFGLHEFFRTQDQIGIGVANVVGSPFGWYYVVLIGECV
jgi:uncharacterized protein YkwD